MMRLTAFLIGAGLLAGCQTLSAPDLPGEDAPAAGPVAETPAQEDARACPAAAYQVLVGQPVGEIHTSSLPQPNRIYSFNDAITMDYRSDRLNIVTDDADNAG